MGRLIDADGLKKIIDDWHPLGIGRRPINARQAGAMEAFADVVNFIDDAPTAYDVDKVVEQIKKVYACNNCHRPDECNECTVGEVIEIIKKGGIE